LSQKALPAGSENVLDASCWAYVPAEMGSATPFIAAVLLVVGAAIVYFFALPGAQKVDLTGPDAPLNMREKVARALSRAGVFDQAPSIILVALAGIGLVVYLLLSLVLGFLYPIFLAPIIVIGGFFWFLHRRQRRFINRAHDELIPFFNHMATSIGGNVSAPRAYEQAVMESNALKMILEPSAVKIRAGEPFAPTLVETLPLLPIRMWSVFVRQIELHEEVGGDLGETMQSTVRQVNKMLQLQAEARADYAIQAKQQQLIIGILVAGFGFMIVIVPNGKDMAKTLVTTGLGIAGLCIGLSVIAFGLWFLNKQLRDVERKLNF
jgi:Flp pilus assembly protein TadB